ncbi:MAG: 5,10-methenyltetrahydrofolate synthetase [Chthoniobacteraceae bacterium]|nr:5,10-methenyltetrahydrofolate synthetase [Chthoniobacteraceae bacterium]
MESKVQVRQRIREALRFPPEMAAAKSGLLCAALVEDPAWSKARTVAVFAPHTGEPDIERLAPHALLKKICYPRVRGNELDFFRVTDPAKLVVSRWKLREPLFDSAHAVALEEIDLILVPGVAFTRSGARLGRGGGYYDRLLGNPAVRALRIGVCFEVQIVESLPSEPHDIGVDRVLTEAGLF